VQPPISDFFKRIPASIKKFVRENMPLADRQTIDKGQTKNSSEKKYQRQVIPKFMKKMFWVLFHWLRY
jgi:hypothetical protein